MTLLLVMEAIDEGRIKPTDSITISSYAASMGGSQVFLEEGEIMSVEELIKCTVIASANDAAVALAEHISGSENLFVNKMNRRASDLGLKNTCFENVTGLDDTTEHHLTSALDIALMSRELIKYELIKKYSSLWQDTIRDGEFTLTNTNRLVRYYDGCNGLKTGSTDKAGYCISASAKRGGMELIAVVMGAKTRDERNRIAKELLDFGFATYGLYRDEGGYLQDADCLGATRSSVGLYADGFSCVVGKGDLGRIERVYDIPQELAAPVASGETVGTVRYFLHDREIGTVSVRCAESVEKIGYGRLLWCVLRHLVCGCACDG